MPWTRSGDTSDDHPALMAVLDDPAADDRLLNEVAGLIWRLSTYTARHLTDGVITRGVLRTMSGSITRGDQLAAIAVRAGLLREDTVDGQSTFQIIDDAEFIHVRSRAEIEWERQQRNDTRTPSIKGPVLLRDGDVCRWCDDPVVWSGPKTKRRGTLDHLTGGSTPDAMVVACQGCNGARRDDPTWSHTHKLKPERLPAQRIHGKATTAYLQANGYMASDGSYLPAAVAPPIQLATLKKLAGPTADAPAEPHMLAGDARTDAEQHDTEGDAEQAPAEPSQALAGPEDAADDVEGVHALVADSVSTSAPPCLDLPGRDGTGREGKGREGPGRDWPGTGMAGQGRETTAPPAVQQHKSRGRRKRGRGRRR